MRRRPQGEPDPLEETQENPALPRLPSRAAPRRPVLWYVGVGLAVLVAGFVIQLWF